MDGGRASVLLALAVLLTAGSSVDGQVRLLVPEQSPGGPFYARFERGVVLRTDEWVAIPFYREPECVRPDFNLLNFFDFDNPVIFSCTLTVHGFDIRADPTSPAPRHSKLQGNGAVPVWFVSVEDYTGALPGVTITDLLAMPSLVQGVATYFEETLHPLGIAQQATLEIVASGYLPDESTFHLVAIEATGELRHVGIEFR